MEAYESFARVYDDLMDNIPYEEWADYILQLLHEYHINDGLLAELGCGTGNITERLANAGYDMIGIDNSTEMLEIANEKKQEHHLPSILYLLQDMREFELFGTVNAIICVCDSINYLLDTNEITEVFRLANNYLEADGLFICDFKTRHYFKDIVADSTIAEDREDVSFIWDNYYDEESNINELALSLFIKAAAFNNQPFCNCNRKNCDALEGGSSANNDMQTTAPENNIYRKYQEFHYQRGLTIEEMKHCIDASGMELVTMYDAFTHHAATEDSERIYVIAREKKQEGKYYIKERTYKQ